VVSLTQKERPALPTDSSSSPSHLTVQYLPNPTVQQPHRHKSAAQMAGSSVPQLTYNKTTVSSPELKIIEITHRAKLQYCRLQRIRFTSEGKIEKYQETAEKVHNYQLSEGHFLGTWLPCGIRPVGSSVSHLRSSDCICYNCDNCQLSLNVWQKLLSKFFLVH
jgi:hypothetical protein